MTELESFFSHYAERDIASDVDAVTAMSEAPAPAIREGRVIHLADEATLREHLAGPMDAYARAGATRAEVASLHVDQHGVHAANATVSWHVSGADGALIREFRTTYHLARAGDACRIRTYTNHDE